MRHFIHQLKRVKLKDLLAIWKFPIALLCAALYRRKRKNLWIVCEDRNEARDNGYWFFQYVRREHPEQDCVYAISGQSPDIEKIRAIGDWVEYGSLKHWILYLASEKKISSQKAGNPNAAIFYALEVYGFLKDKRVFLQHGVTINDSKWLYYDVTKVNRFICGAYPEYQYVDSTFGYPKGNVCYTGFCRFDGWHNAVPSKPPMVLIMPTWREWIADEDYRLKEYEGTTDIPKTQYFTAWIDFISDGKIACLAEKYGVRFVFYPHRNMQKYAEYFPQSGEHMEITFAKDRDIQDLLREASMMITDYSSVFFDMLYMKKPVIFYQFDYDRFRRGQYGEGYFDYRNNPFGNSYAAKSEVFLELETIIKNGFAVSDEYLNAHKTYFPLYDTDNCKRVYDVANNL